MRFFKRTFKRPRIWDKAQQVVDQAQLVMGGGYYLVPDHLIDSLRHCLAGECDPAEKRPTEPSQS